MALDFTNNTLGELPIYLDFTTRTEPTRMAGKKYVINNDTDEVIGIVGSKFFNFLHTAQQLGRKISALADKF